MDETTTISDKNSSVDHPSLDPLLISCDLDWAQGFLLLRFAGILLQEMCVGVWVSGRWLKKQLSEGESASTDPWK